LSSSAKQTVSGTAPGEQLGVDGMISRNSEGSDEEGITTAERLHRISIALLPLRCFFDGMAINSSSQTLQLIDLVAPFIDLIRTVVDSVGSSNNSGSGLLENASSAPRASVANPIPDAFSAEAAASAEPAMFFQNWYMSPISLKIDYEPRAVFLCVISKPFP
jgi:hypothetical protein